VDAWREPEPQLARLAAGQRAGERRGRIRSLDGGARGHEQLSPGLRQRDAPPGAGEQRHAELCLQPLDLLTQRGLGDVQARGGAAEVQLFGQHHERAQQPRVETHARSL
jgi:hypothetical protein